MRVGLIKDLVMVAAIVILSLLLSGFLLTGQYLDTTYADWMYHAFRALSLQRYGLTSWDSLWDNGISYWRAYQMIPAAITVATSWLLHVSITKAMIILTVALYTGTHVGIYWAVRAYGRSRLAALAASLLTFLFSGYWLIMKDYSISFAAGAVPLMLIGWKISRTSPTARLWFAMAIGYCVYIHPLLALCFGGLWLFEKLILRTGQSLWSWALELSVMMLPVFFYAYGLTAMDQAQAAPYQLAKSFIYSVAGSFKLGSLFVFIIPVLIIVGTFKRQWLSKEGRVLVWFTALLCGVAILNLNTTQLDFLNRYQLTRTVFFIAMAYAVVAGDAFDGLTSTLKQWTRGVLIAALVGLAIGQSLSDTSTYAATPVDTMPDAVSEFLRTTPRPEVSGSIFIAGSTASSYFNPTLRFTNGYNDQLLPQLVNDRLNQLLAESSPTRTISASGQERINDYVSILGIQYLFLPVNSPYIQPLTESGFSRVSQLQTEHYNLVVLRTNETPRYASIVSSESAAILTRRAITARAGDTSYDTQMDEVISRAASIKQTGLRKGAAAPAVEFLRPDELRVTVESQDRPSAIYLNQSYSKLWTANAGTTIKRTSEGFMLVTLPAGQTSVTLKHTWGHAPIVQAVASIGAVVIIAIAWSVRRRHKRRTSAGETS